VARSALPSAEPLVLDQWAARKIQPITVLHVALVFVGCMALAYFVFHSMTGVRALALAAVGFILPLVAGLSSRVEYRLTETGLEQRPLQSKKLQSFQDAFRWDQLDHVVPKKHGIKFYKILNEPKPLRRFWKAHVSDAYSGEIHVETEDRERVLRIVTDHGIPTSKPVKRS
jgi:hypothetical protein